MRRWLEGECNLALSTVFFDAMNPSRALPGNRRFFALTPVLLAFVLLSGCAKSEPQRTVDAAAKSYACIKVGMSKQEVVARLGDPSSGRELRYRWETSAGRDFNASLEVRFDSADKVVSVANSKASAD